jgi:2-polyprenyl-3-methyl-5-hydroxy-6-metoxy-1,4-benzoquinol methylase
VAAKQDFYYAVDRGDVLAHLPTPYGRVLDVGCGAGTVGRELLARGAVSVTGVEIVASAAALAAEVYDEVRVGSADEELAALEGPFETIVCYDVLEHLVDPWAVLRRLHELASPGAHLHVSVPNARHLQLVYDIVLRGTFGYTEWGHRDNTHLRWFTPKDMRRSLGEAGWRVLSESHTELSWWRRGLARATHGRSSELLAYQWQFLAQRDAAANARS